MGYTKGPWKTGREDMESWTGDGVRFTNIYGNESEGRHEVTGDELPVTVGRAEGENSRENARLMAAAPELLEACQEALEYLIEQDWRGDEVLQPLKERIEAVIKKAEGQVK